MSTITPPIRTQGSLSHLSSASHLHIALAQVYPSDYQADDGHADDAPADDDSFRTGFAKLRAYAAEAARLGADVVAFPEYFLTGASHERWNAVAQRGAPRPHGAHGGDEDEEKHWLEEVCALARELDINIVAGTVVEAGHHAVPHRRDSPSSSSDSSSPDSPARPFNTAYFVGRCGTVLGRYTKRNLWHPERLPLAPGHPETHPAPLLFEFTTRRAPQRGITAAMQVCWDLAFPEAFRQLLQVRSDGGAPEEEGRPTGPDVIFVPTCWYATDAGEPGLRWNPSPSGEASILDALTLTRALECESLLCMVNVAGKGWGEAGAGGKSAKELAEGEPIGVGRSTVVSPFLGIVGRIEGPEEGLLLASVDLGILKDVREVYRIREDLASQAHLQAGVQ